MKKILLLVVVAICLVIGGKQYQQHKMAEEIAGKIIRFHVLANSDSQEDQNLKLEVRDAIGAFMQPRLANVTDIESSRQIVQESIPDIEQKAEEVISEKGYTYTVSARLSNIDFPEKTYGPYTFQAGNYEALEVVIGEGEGHNWWCVM